LKPVRAGNATQLTSNVKKKREEDSRNMQQEATTSRSRIVPDPID